ncbi:unnamed protein product [Hydatigera taeniaeformis]|uniref:RH1 domain-containing protein n=1 Tax=Hydatigena taeniaeformis TaxID=6205 RepID=A0A158REN5_HYDTA|nr:unnamed protein product [Hydatigera taeniaeformis]
MESASDSSSNYLSPHVQNIALLVCSEFERLISRYGEGVVDGIVPIMIQTLEQVEQLHEANELLQASWARDELRVESLTLKLDREIKGRRAAEERVIELEDEIADLTIRTNKQSTNYTRLIHVLEAKCAAASDYMGLCFVLVTRQEAKEAELRLDLTNAQNRFNELLRSRVAHVERVRNHVNSILTERSSISECHRLTSTGSISHRDSICPTKESLVFPSPFHRTDYERYLGEQSLTRMVSEDLDLVSEVSDGCDFLGSESLEAEVKKLLIENQELTEMKQALNVLKDDLLTRIDDISGENQILKSDLKTCQEELAAERQRARNREHQLVERVQRLTSKLRAMELHEGGSRSALTRCASLDLGGKPSTIQASGRRRIHSCSAALPTIKSKPQQQQRQDSKRAPLERVESTNRGTLKLTKREVDRVLMERNYYKERYLEAKTRLCAIENPCLVQQPFAHMRKREIASVLVSRIFQSMHNFASDVAQGLDGLIAPAENSTPPPSSSRTSTALWNILGNFVGQAVTYTADAVIGTGSDLPLDVSRPVITANINSRLPIAPPHPRNQPSP